MMDSHILIDSHCHLDFPDFDNDRHQVINDAHQQGVQAICIPGTSACHWQRILNLISPQPEPVQLYAALGIHPWFIGHHQPSDLQALEHHLKHKHSQVVAVGEIGLDFSLENIDAHQQMHWFSEQLDIAKQFNLPVIIHARKAHDQILKQLRSKSLKKGGIIHAFSGSAQQANQYIELGFKLGFGGGITYSRASKTRQLATDLPLDALVLETDAPDMPLHCFQGQRNTPAQLLRVLKNLAKLRSDSISTIAIRTQKNTIEVLGLDSVN